MSYVIVANETASSTTLLVDDVELASQFTDHFSLIPQLIVATCNGGLLVAPFLYEDFNVIFDACRLLG
jgi:adenosyl cobinamide kinase/adenosyl cobinamide phosphate guanylyltransferase